MRVYPVAGCDGGNRMADRIAVFGDDVVFLEVCQGDFVALRDFLAGLQRQPVKFKLFASGDRAQGYSHGIPRIHFH
ncbi:hypothetical protein D3C73_1453430 [compost metagenome]